jgi:hypothetical protein
LAASSQSPERGRAQKPANSIQQLAGENDVRFSGLSFKAHRQSNHFPGGFKQKLDLPLFSNKSSIEVQKGQTSPTGQRLKVGSQNQTGA